MKPFYTPAIAIPLYLSDTTDYIEVCLDPLGHQPIGRVIDNGIGVYPRFLTCLPSGVAHEAFGIHEFAGAVATLYKRHCQHQGGGLCRS